MVLEEDMRSTAQRTVQEDREVHRKVEVGMVRSLEREVVESCCYQILSGWGVPSFALWVHRGRCYNRRDHLAHLHHTVLT